MCRLVLLIVAGIVLAAPAAAQIPVEDRPEVAAAALRAVADTAYSEIAPETRLWLNGWFTTGDWTSREGISDDVTLAIQDDFPGARQWHGPQSELFLCAPGEEVRMPGNGCPIEDGGRIIWFQDGAHYPDTSGFQAGPGVTRLVVSVVTTACDGDCTWRVGWRVSLRQGPDGRWHVMGVRQGIIT